MPFACSKTTLVPHGTFIVISSPCFPVLELFSPSEPFIAEILRDLIWLKSEKEDEHFKKTDPPFPPFPPELARVCSFEKPIAPSPPEPLLIIRSFFIFCIRTIIYLLIYVDYMLGDVAFFC